MSLLRIVPLEGKHGEKSFDNVPLLDKWFGAVEIDIRDDAGRTVQFERCNVTVTLHLRRRKTGLF